MKTMNLILAILGVTLLVFTIAMIVLFCLYQSIPDTLVACVFTAMTGECGAMAWIKTAKEKYSERKEKEHEKVSEQVDLP